MKRNRPYRRANVSSHHQMDTDCNVDEGSAIIQLFRTFQLELDARHDKHERIVKLSRDITIDSKRIIFLMHRIDSDTEMERILADVQYKLQELQRTKWRAIAQELVAEDPYHFLRAYSPGLQEYVEALSFWHYMKEQSLISLQQVEATLIFNNDAVVLTSATVDSSTDEMQSLDIATGVPQPGTAYITVHVPPMEYMLGLADLTGELMRLAIHSVGNGVERAQPVPLCRLMRAIHEAFLTVSGGGVRELSHKMSTLRQSVQKVETACYTLQVRGSEIPRHLLAAALNSGGTRTNDYDETIVEDSMS